MKQPLRLLLIWALVLSPVWVGMLIVLAKPYERGSLGMMLGQAVGVTVIGLIGLVISVLTRKVARANRISVMGYVIPAILVCGYEIFNAAI